MTLWSALLVFSLVTSTVAHATGLWVVRKRGALIAAPPTLHERPPRDTWKVGDDGLVNALGETIQIGSDESPVEAMLRHRRDNP